MFPFYSLNKPGKEYLQLDKKSGTIPQSMDTAVQQNKKTRGRSSFSLRNFIQNQLKLTTSLKTGSTIVKVLKHGCTIFITTSDMLTQKLLYNQQMFVNKRPNA